MRRTFSVPAWWPARRGMPRRLAQRPLPSMMMPTWAGTASGTGCASACAVDLDWAPATIDTRSDLQHFGFFVSRNVLHAFDEAIGQLLEALLGTFFVLLGNTAVFLRLAQMIE